MQERSGERHGEAKRHGDRPDAERDREPERKRPGTARRTAGPDAGWRRARWRTSRTIRASMPASADGSARSSRAWRRPSRAGSPARTNSTASAGERDDCRRSRRPTSRRQTRPGSRSASLLTEEEDVGGQQHQHGQRVEQPLEDDGREGAGRAHPLVAREKIRADHLAGARRQHAAGGKADGRGAKRVGEGRSPPAARADTASATARIARFTNIVASDSAEPVRAGAHDLATTTPRRSTLCRNSAEQPDHEREDDESCGNVIACELRAPSTILLYRRRRGAAATCCCCQPCSAACKIQRLRRTRNLLPPASPIIQTTLGPRPPDRHGKVRDIYDFGDRLLIVATDRISAFDYVLGSGIPDKGKVLTQISAFWFERLRGIVANHLLSLDPANRSRTPRRRRRRCCAGRSMLVQRPSRCRSSASRAAICRDRGGRTTRPPAKSAASRCPPACASRTGCRSRSSRRRPRRRAATTSTSPKPRRHDGRPAALLERVRDLTLRLYAEGAAHAEIVRHHRRRHQVRIRPAAAERAGTPTRSG